MKTALLIIVLIIVMMVCTSCLPHPFLQPDSREAILKVAGPYMSQECKQVGIYAGYTLDWSGLQDEATDYENGFGGIVGGCNRWALIGCVLDDPCTVVGCKRAVLCKTIQELVPNPE